MKLFTHLFGIVFWVVFLNTASAQKRPRVQNISVRAPSNIKIDGKLNEWPDKLLAAYNSSSRIYYTVSNDDNNLYLTVRGTDNLVARKILAGGLVFTITHSIGKKAKEKNPDNVTIAFPAGENTKTVSPIMSLVNQIVDFPDTVANKKQIDSIVYLANIASGNVIKEIGISGITEIPDSVISVYNSTGVKAALQFIQMQPVIEIAIPLKYLRLTAGSEAKLSYHIQINALPGVKNEKAVQFPPPVNVDPNSPPPLLPTNALFPFSNTDFWGEYTLAKQ